MVLDMRRQLDLIFRDNFIDPFTSHNNVLLDCRIWRDAYTIVEGMLMKLIIPKIDIFDGL